MQRRRVARILGVGLAIALPFVLLRFQAVREVLVALMAFMRGAGALGVAAFFAAQTAAALLLTPIWLMSGIAGYVYGFSRGSLVALVGTVIAASATFGVGRLLSGGTLQGFVPSSPRLAAIARLAAHHGLKVTLLLRATPVMPQNLLGYMLAATPLSYRNFALGTALGLIPATVMHAYVGSIVDDAIALVSGKTAVPGALSWVVFGGGAVITIATVTLTARLARRELEKALREAAESGTPTT